MKCLDDQQYVRVVFLSCQESGYTYNTQQFPRVPLATQQAQARLARMNRIQTPYTHCRVV